jgi:hypothetical protein
MPIINKLYREYVNLKWVVHIVPIKVAACSNARTVFAQANTGDVGLIPTRGMDVCVRLFCFYAVLGIGSGLEIGWSPYKESYQLCIGLQNWKSSQGPTKGCRATDECMVHVVATVFGVR